MEVDDIRSVGITYTWTNKREGWYAVNKKLDRVLGNWEWHKCFNHRLSLFHNQWVSDHSPTTMNILESRGSMNRPFKFVNHWATHEQFLSLIKRIWKQKVVENPLEVALYGTINLKRELKSF
ncbi:hypothetical protein CFOL_v3_09475 [Cephalotus follicularis]|uniref:Exo_endo_phos domain-containing protein n=1 Tax=Cephalotus follicularis TaxID=3775 RepID=A0A1Q3BDU8_CEPFO|nr:hypothetical protein CFOL_v3_09475 [Cephalotus follicularis]